MELPEQIGKISKGKSSLAEALKQLDVVKKAFVKTEEIKEKLTKHENEMNNMRVSMGQMIHTKHFAAKIEEITGQIERSLARKFEEFTSVYFSELSSKISEKNIEASLNKKVSWASFNSLSQQVANMKTRLDKHLYSEYEGFKTKVKLELANKSNEVKYLPLNNKTS